MDELQEIYDGLQNSTLHFNNSIPNSFVVPKIVDLIDLFRTGQLPVNKKLAQTLILLNEYTDYSLSDTQ